MNSESLKELSAMVPQSWIAQFESLSQQKGRSVEELVREAIAQYLGIPEATPTHSIELEAVQKKLEALSQKLSTLEVACDRISRLETRLNALERLSQPSLMSNLSTVQKIEDEADYEYDEPDEILSDFLPR